MRHVLVLVLALTPVLLSGSNAMAGACGPRKTVDKVVIEFDCNGVDAARIRRFTSRGFFKYAFDGKEQILFDLQPRSPFEPPDIPMSFDGGGDCVVGERMERGGTCVARYLLPCAAHRYALKVDTKSDNTWVRIDRSIRRRNAATRCDIPWAPTDVVDQFSDVERVTVTVFQHNPARKLFRIVLDVAQVTAPTFSQTFDRLQDIPRGQSSGAISENARWLIDRKDPNAPRIIDLRLVRETP